MSAIEWRRYWLLGSFGAWIFGVVAVGAIGIALSAGNRFGMMIYSLLALRFFYLAVEQRSYVRVLRDRPPRSRARTVRLWLLTAAAVCIPILPIILTPAPPWLLLTTAAVVGLLFVPLPDPRHLRERLGIGDSG